jgi:hypothetical protein
MHFFKMALMAVERLGFDARIYVMSSCVHLTR